MKNLTIAFDIDDTLIVPCVATGSDRDTPNYENIAIFKYFQKLGCNMILWSGSGMDWARTWGEKLGLQPFNVITKEKHISVHDGLPLVDICFDDCDVDLAKTNIKVSRINNSISRKNWNSTKRLKEHGGYWSTMVEILERQFPKGECKERGRALIMLSYIEMMLQGVEFEDGEPKK